MSAVTAYRLGYRLARILPWWLLRIIVSVGARVAIRVSPDRALIAARNLDRASGRTFEGREQRAAVRRLFAAYGRYWAESFRLPSMAPSRVDAGFGVEGYHHIDEAYDRGVGPILVLPHLGGWEWAAYWMTGVQGRRVTVVVEALEPPELLEFFAAFRRQLGMEIVVLGPAAGTAVSSALRRGDLVCLLADRDIEGTGIAVDFFGERTTLPAGPAALAIRTGAALIPAAVYFDGPRHHAVVRPPLDTARRDGFRSDVARVTQVLADELEGLIRRAPEQWHLLQPNWPSDREALGAADHAEPAG